MKKVVEKHRMLEQWLRHIPNCITEALDILGHGYFADDLSSIFSIADKQKAVYFAFVEKINCSFAILGTVPESSAFFTALF